MNNLFSILASRAALLSVDVQDILNGTQSNNGGEAFTNLSSNVKDVGYGIYSILGVVAVLVFLIVGGFGFVKGFFLGTPQERQEFKSGAAFKILMIIGFFALGSLIVILSQMGGKLFTTGG